MRILYLECNMGAAGDMLLAALLELHPVPDAFISRLNKLGIPGVTVKREQSTKCGIVGTHVSVSIGGVEEESLDVSAGSLPAGATAKRSPLKLHKSAKLVGRKAESPTTDSHSHGHSHGHDHNHGHSHAKLVGISEIHSVLAALDITVQVREHALKVYQLISEAESVAHGVPVEAVHFHEVGMMDAVADIVGVAMLIEELAVERIVVSPIHVGSGMVKIDHGILPVPAPATAYILRGVPSYGGKIQGELCTPTGAALVKHFADTFGDRPLMTTSAVGYGMGKKDFAHANCVRAFLGTTEHETADIVELACNLDDLTGEELGFTLEILLEAGALDAYIQSIQMKKSRPAFLLTCLCRSEDEEKLSKLILSHTSTFGVRTRSWRRYTLDRRVETIDTAYGPVRLKHGQGYGIIKQKVEYDDLARIAREMNISIAEARSLVLADNQFR